MIKACTCHSLVKGREIKEGSGDTQLEVNSGWFIREQLGFFCIQESM